MSIHSSGEIVKQSVFLITFFWVLVIQTSPANSESFNLTYTYDNLDRLTSVSYGSESSISYQYDDTGNILRVVMQGEDLVQTVDLPDVILTLQTAAGITPDLSESNISDINGDGKISIQEAIYFLQELSKSQE